MEKDSGNIMITRDVLKRDEIMRKVDDVLQEELTFTESRKGVFCLRLVSLYGSSFTQHFCFVVKIT